MNETKYYKYTIQIPIINIIESEYSSHQNPIYACGDCHQFEKESAIPIKDSTVSMVIESSTKLDQTDIEYKISEIFEKLIEFPDKAKRMFRELGY